MLDHDVLCKSLLALFSDKLNVDVTSAESELLQSGVLDSMTLVELFLLLEREFDVKISVETLEIEHFQSIATIARFIAQATKPT